MNADSTTQYIRNTLRRSEGLLKELEAYAAEHHVPIIQPETASLLNVLGRLKKPSRILEVGTAIGYSAITMSRFLEPGGRIDTIELNERSADIAEANIKRAGLEKVINLIRGDAHDVLQCLERQYDMIFLDAAKGQYPEFMPDCLRLLSREGLLVTDNVLYKGMVAGEESVVRRKKTIVTRLRSYLEEICANPELDTSIVPIGDGVAISYKLNS
jgi:predicted O-methyltransferase YrrM